MKTQAKRIFWNALLLTAASLLMKTVGVWFQVTLSNRVGAEAMGLFSLMGGVYGFALTLATSGFHLGVTRVVVEAIGKKQPKRVAPAMRRATLYALSFGIFASSLLLFFAKPIGLFWLKDARTIPSLRLFGLTLPLISLSSAWSGYFTAVRRAYKNAAVQVLEQGAKIGFTMFLLASLAPVGIEGTCCVLVLGGALAETLSFLAELLLYLTDRKKSFPGGDGNGRAEGRKLLGITLPIAFTTYVRSGLLTLEHILIPEGLRNSGATHSAALRAYGTIQSMALPIILYPAALISSFAGLLVPEMAESSVQKGEKRINYMVGRVWSLSLLFSIGVAGILICFSGEIGQALYPNTQTAYYIRWLAPLIPIMYVDTATDAMLKGLGQQVYSMKINIADALISVILVWLLIPRYGILGYVITIYFSETFNTVFSISRLLSLCKPPVHLLKWVYKPLLCIVGATCGSRMLLLACKISIPHQGLSIVFHCLLVLTLYLILLLLTQSLDREDLQWIKTLFCKEHSTETMEAPRLQE